MTKLILVRHCEARGNADRVFQGLTDADVSERGMQQLERLAERFKKVELDAVYSSPLRRALYTADAVNKYHGLPVHVEKGLIEINGGHWEGKKWADFPTLYPDEARDWNLRPWAFAPEGGESMVQVYQRISRAVMAIAQREQHRTVAVVSHGCAIRNFLCYAKGYAIEKLNEIDWSDNTGVSMVEVDAAGHMRVTMENDVSHLTEDLSTFSRQSWWKRENRDSLTFD